MTLFKFNQDAGIVERIKNNDRKVLGELYLKYERLVVDQVNRLGGDRQMAEDLLQEAIIVLWQKVSSGDFKVKAKMSTFVVSVVRNKYLNRVRKDTFQPLSSSEEQHEDDNPGILETIISQEESDAVHLAMEKLHEICQKILVMYYFEKRSLKEIASLLNFANERVAKSKKYQCKESLKGILQQNLYSGGEKQ